MGNWELGEGNEKQPQTHNFRFPISHSQFLIPYKVIITEDVDDIVFTFSLS